MNSMTFEELTAALARLPEAQASVLPTGAVLAAALGDTAALAAAQERRRQEDERQEEDRQRRLFFADAQDQGVSEQDAQKILALAFSDEGLYARCFGSPYDLAHALLQVVEATGGPGWSGRMSA
jgi:hypothetical protein